MSHAGSAKEVAEGEEIHVLLDSKSAVDCRAEFRMLFSIPKRGVPCVAAFVCSMLTCCVFFPWGSIKDCSTDVLPKWAQWKKKPQIIYGFKTKFDLSAKMQLDDDMPSFVRWEFHKDHSIEQ